MAFMKDGYRYHTKYDGFSNIPLGSFQHAGDNSLSLIKSIANAPEMDLLDDQPWGKVVFFDVFGLFMIYYGDTLTVIINIIVTVVSIVAFIIFLKDFEMGKLIVHTSCK